MIWKQTYILQNLTVFYRQWTGNNFSNKISKPNSGNDRQCLHNQVFGEVLFFPHQFIFFTAQKSERSFLINFWVLALATSFASFLFSFCLAGAYRYYRIDVTANAGANYWCLEELSFYGHDGDRLELNSADGFAETEHPEPYTASFAFNEQTDAVMNSKNKLSKLVMKDYQTGNIICQGSMICFFEDASYYCSQNGVATGWLAYDFHNPTVVSKYVPHHRKTSTILSTFD